MVLNNLGHIFEGGITLCALSSHWEGSCIELRCTHSCVPVASGFRRFMFSATQTEMSF